MPPLTALRFDNTYARLHPSLYEVIDPTPLADPRLIAFNASVAALIDLDPQAAADPDAPALLSGARRLPGAEPLAMLYAGHQFGVWVPQLGDGRAILLGQIRNAAGKLWDLHLKGGGPTRFSRMGDGRAVLRSTIREYLASEAMHGLGIPTTRALAIVGSNEVVYRETPETAATLIRVAPSHVRFGSFQILAARGETDRIRELMDYLITEHDPDLVGLTDRAARWLERAVDRTADMIAQWMAVGFAHGVMNTDNMSVLGLTMDYGPYGFLDEYEAGFICNHTDHEGRYAFDRQPAVALWNLARFAEALLDLVTLEEATAILNRYPALFERRYNGLMHGKLGLETERDDDAAMIVEMFGLMQANQIDYTRWFRALARTPRSAETVPDLPRLDAWMQRYRERLDAEGSDDLARTDRMNRVNPKYVLRNYLAQRAIEQAVAGDWSEIERLQRLLATPFDEHPDMATYAEGPPPSERHIVVSCSS